MGGCDLKQYRVTRATARLRVQVTDDEWKTLANAQREVARVKNALIYAYWAQDREDLAKNGGKPPKPWKLRELNPSGYQRARKLAPELASGICSQIAREAHAKWISSRWDALVRCSISPPHYRETGPIPIRHQDYSLVHGDGGVLLRTSLQAGRWPGGRQFGWQLKARDGHQLLLMSELAKAESVLARDAKLERDQRGRWYVRIGYTRLVPVRDGAREAALHRGIRTFLCAITDSGEEWRYDGEDIEAYLAKLFARRRAIQRQIKVSSRVGRGRKRALLAIRKLEDKGTRWRQTRCQVIARRVAQWLASQGTTRVYIEDFSGIRKTPEEWTDKLTQRVQEWPYYQLQTRVVSCLEELGVEVWQVPLTIKGEPKEKRITATCPECGAAAEPSRRGPRWELKCSADGAHVFELEYATATNLLARGLLLYTDKPGELTRLSAQPVSWEDGARKPSSKRSKPNGKSGAGEKPLEE